MELLKRWGTEALELLYPPTCMVCLEPGEDFCLACRDLIRPVDAGHELPATIAAAVAVGLHEGPLRDAVLRLKYSYRDGLARPLAELCADVLARQAWSAGLQGVCPVPMHPWRQFVRGYNQAELLAEELARRLKLPLLRLLCRTRYLRPQVGQSSAQRRDAIRGSMAIRRRTASPERLLIVDDVRTTGATLEEAGRALREAGAVQVYAATVTMG